MGMGMGQGEGVKIVEHIWEVEDDRFRSQQWFIATTDSTGRQHCSRSVAHEKQTDRKIFHHFYKVQPSF